jgi:SAM-dependent methyltransferase
MRTAEPMSILASPWDSPDTVAGFVRSPPNAELLAFAQRERRRLGGERASALALDLGCGAARNAAPLAVAGWRVLGLDLSLPMLLAAGHRADAPGALRLACSTMERLPVADRVVDLMIAHGIWNLAASAAGFRRAIAEAARVAKPGAGLFVFTFSRNTLPPDAEPYRGEPFVFTQFSGRPQCFLSEAQLIEELSAVGFDLEPNVPLRELNGARSRTLGGGPPVILEGVFRRAI